MARDDLKNMFLSELEPLLKIYSPTGKEAVMLPYLKSKLEKQGFTITTDPSGMLLGLRNESESIKIPGLCAHYDTFNKKRRPLIDDSNFRKNININKIIKNSPPNCENYRNNEKKYSYWDNQYCTLRKALEHERNSPTDGKEFIWAPNIHLGLDCKVGIAMILTLINNYDKNKPLAVLFTAGEEDGKFRRSVDREDGHSLSADFISHLQRMSYCLLLDRQGRKDMVTIYNDRDLLNDDQIDAWSRILNMQSVTSPNMSDAYGLAGLEIPCANISNGVYGEHDYEDFLVVDYAEEIIQNALKWLNAKHDKLGI
ncbi:MAG: hypothetical protein RBS89_07295 [Candidatus Delongbacteria bacterium]|jgi:hypothetical protein|nr:hypothetical protein [Candidatus Delongbacteria bacterium]